MSVPLSQTAVPVRHITRHISVGAGVAGRLSCTVARTVLRRWTQPSSVSSLVISSSRLLL